MANDLVLKTSFEGTSGFSDWGMIVGDISFNNRVCSNVYASDGVTSAKAGPSENCILTPIVPVSKTCKISFDLLFPAGQNWFSGGTIFRFGNGTYGEVLFLANADTVTLTSLTSVDDSTNCTLPCGIAANLTFEYTADSTIITSVNGEVVSTVVNTRTYLSGSDFQLTHSGTEFFFGCTYYLDNLIVLNDPTAVLPPKVLNRLIYSPDQSTYSVGDQQNRVTTNYGIAGKYRRNLLNANRPVSVTWTCSKEIYTYLAQAYKAFVSSGGVPFICQLKIDSIKLEDFKVTFVNGSFGLTSVKGESYTIKALLNVQPKPYDVVNNDWTTDSGLTRRIINIGSGAYVLTGFTVDFRLSVTHLFANAGLYVLTGHDANIFPVRFPSGFYTLTGYDVNLTYSNGMFAAKGLYTLTGNPVGLTKTP